MWKENLPNNCPPNNAREASIDVFRILKDSVPSEDDFKPYARMYSENPRYKTLCKAHAISFYDSLKNATIAWKAALDRGNNLGTHIAQYSVSEVHGKHEFKPETGHYSTWFFSTWDFQTFNASFVSEINGN